MSAVGDMFPAIIEFQVIGGQAIAEMKKINGELAVMQGEADRTGLAMERLKAGAKGAAMVGAAMAAVGVGVAAYAVHAAEGAQVALIQVGQAMSDAKQNTAANREVITGSIDAYAKLGFTTEDTAAAYTKLVTATGSVAKSHQLMGLTADFARLKNIPLAQAASIMSKATQGSTKAFKEFGITLDTHLPKNQAVQKAFDQLAGKIGGQANAYTQTLSGKMKVLTAEVKNVAEKVGSALIPIVSTLVGWLMILIDKVLKPLFEWIGKNATAIVILTGAIFTAMAVSKIWSALMVVQTVVMQAYAFATYEATLAGKAMTFMQGIFNAVMDANPVGVVVVALGLLAAAFVWCWNHMKPFRDAMVDFFQIILAGVRMFLQALAKLIGAAASLPFVGGAFKSVAGGIDTAANAVDGLSKKLNGLRNSSLNLDLFGAKGGALQIPSTSAGGPADTTGLGSLAPVTAAAGAAKKVATAASKKAAEVKAEIAKIDAHLAASLAAENARYNTSVARMTGTYTNQQVHLTDMYQKQMDATRQQFAGMNSLEASSAMANELAPLTAQYSAASAATQGAMNAQLAALKSAHDLKDKQLKAEAAAQKQKIQNAVNHITVATTNNITVVVAGKTVAKSVQTSLRTEVQRYASRNSTTGLAKAGA